MYKSYSNLNMILGKVDKKNSQNMFNTNVMLFSMHSWLNPWIQNP